MNLLKKLSTNFLIAGGSSLLIALILHNYIEETDWYDMPKFFRNFLKITIGNSYSKNYLSDIILLILVIIGVIFVLASAVFYFVQTTSKNNIVENIKTEKKEIS